MRFRDGRLDAAVGSTPSPACIPHGCRALRRRCRGACSFSRQRLGGDPGPPGPIRGDPSDLLLLLLFLRREDCGTRKQQKSKRGDLARQREKTDCELPGGRRISEGLGSVFPCSCRVPSGEWVTGDGGADSSCLRDPLTAGRQREMAASPLYQHRLAFSRAHGTSSVGPACIWLGDRRLFVPSAAFQRIWRPTRQAMFNKWAGMLAQVAHLGVSLGLPATAQAGDERGRMLAGAVPIPGDLHSLDLLGGAGSRA